MPTQIVSDERGVVVGRAANVADEAAVVKRWGVLPWQVVDFSLRLLGMPATMPGVHTEPKRRRPLGGRTSNDS